jgi:MoaA/NifB/PqqE/SkfB family radical SAM enzyme
MCDFWKSNINQTLEIEDLKRLHELFGKLEFLSINGGEPTLHPKFLEIVRFAHDIMDPSMLLLCSNGSSPSIIKDVTSQFPNLAVSLSFDGIKSHDKIRGVDGALDKLQETISSLQLFQGRKILSFTCQDNNKDEVVESFNFAINNGFEFDFRIEATPFFSNKQEKRKAKYENQLSWLIFHEQDTAKRMFYQGYLNKPKFECLAGKRFVIISSDKKFYPCYHLPISIGDLQGGITKEVNCLKQCWLDCYFYDNFWQSLATMNCVDSQTKNPGISLS